MLIDLKLFKDSDSGDDAFDKMVGGDTSRTSANGSAAAKRERDSSPILDSDDELPPTPPPAKKPAAAAKKKPAAKADSDSDSEFDIKEEDDDDDFVVAKPKQQGIACILIHFILSNEKGCERMIIFLAAAKKPAKKLKNVADLDDDDVKPKAKPKPKPKKTAAPSKAPSKAKKSKASEVRFGISSIIDLLSLILNETEISPSGLDRLRRRRRVVPTGEEEG